MTINGKIKDDKLQCSINREAAKIWAISDKIAKQKYPTGEEIMSSI